MMRESRILCSLGIGEHFFFDDDEYMLAWPSFQDMIVDNLVNVVRTKDWKYSKFDPEMIVEVEVK